MHLIWLMSLSGTNGTQKNSMLEQSVDCLVGFAYLITGNVCHNHPSIHKLQAMHWKVLPQDIENFAGVKLGALFFSCLSLMYCVHSFSLATHGLYSANQIYSLEYNPFHDIYILPPRCIIRREKNKLLMIWN